MRQECNCAACNMRRRQNEVDRKIMVLTQTEQDILRQALKNSVKPVNPNDLKG
jgi:hypothetical protein